MLNRVATCCNPTHIHNSKPVYALSWSSESRLLLSGGGDGCIRLWDLGWSIAKHTRDTAAAATAATATAAAAAAAATAAAPLQNGAAANSASSSSSGSVPAYQQPAARALAVYRGHKNAVWSVDFSPLGYYFASGGGKTKRTTPAHKQCFSLCVVSQSYHQSSCYASRALCGYEPRVLVICDAMYTYDSFRTALAS
jgi:WD40 repeat protein